MQKSLNSFGPGLGARVLAIAFVFTTLAGARASAQQTVAPLGADGATAIATDAYIYGYPLAPLSLCCLSAVGYKPVAFVE
jgi:hypothetical protein